MKKKVVVISSVLVAGILAGGYFALSGSDEERAAKAYESARSYAASGDPARAIIELRNTIQRQPDQAEARIMLAELLIGEGRNAEAFDQYEAVFNGDPENTAAALAMARIAFGETAWEDARAYARAVLARDPANPEARGIAAGVSYRDAVQDADDARREEVAAEAARLLDENPDLLSARRIVISDAFHRGAEEQAAKSIRDGLALYPEDKYLNGNYLEVLRSFGDAAGVERQLITMIALYPEDGELVRDLVRFYVASGRLDAAEQRLRERIALKSSDPEPRLVLLRFLSEVRSPAAMRAELAGVLAESPLPADVAENRSRFEVLKARADYSLGRRDEAMSELEGLIQGEPESDEIDGVKVALAGMRLETGDVVGAGTLVEEVVARDPRQLEALKIKARLLIDRGQAETAITILRDALANAPADPEIMTLLARGYEFTGEPDLTADMFARAAEISVYAPRESLRYALLRLQQGRYADAERVLSEALRRRPEDLDLRAVLARVHIAMEDWGPARDDIRVISERFDSEVSRRIVRELTTQLLTSQGRVEELTAFLNENASGSSDSLSAGITLIRNSLATGGVDQAIARAEALAAGNPTSPVPRGLIVELRLAQGDIETALAEARLLAADYPDDRQGWLLLREAQMQAGQADAALATMDAALARFPGDRVLGMARAGVQEQRGDIEAAIMVYEEMYAANPTDMAVANNLASLLAATRDDPETLNRAWELARRLTGSRDPSFQDTLGWIALRRGDVATALPLLEQAAAGLPRDASVAYHLGKVYAAVGRMDQARSAYDRADQLLAEGGSSYPGIGTEIAAAKAELP